MAEPQEEILKTFVAADGSKFRYRVVRTPGDKIYTREVEGPLGFISLGTIGMPLDLIADMVAQGTLLLNLAPPDVRKVVHLVHLALVRISGANFKSQTPGQGFIQAVNPGIQTLSEEGILFALGTYTDTLIEFPEGLLAGLSEAMTIAAFADGKLSTARAVIRSPFVTLATVPAVGPDLGKLIVDGTDFISAPGFTTSIVVTDLMGGATRTFEEREIALFGESLTDIKAIVAKELVDEIAADIIPGTTKVQVLASGEESNVVLVF